MRIGHFIPSYRPMCDGLSGQLLREQDTLAHRLGYDYRWWAEETSDIVVLRNRALKDAILQECDYLCMQDSDIWSKASVGAIAFLLETARKHDAALVAAICGLRRIPACANVSPCHFGEVYEADKVGTGLVLIDCKQAAKLGGMRFGRKYNEDGTEILVGEDIWFSHRLAEAGMKIYVDGRVPTTHGRRDVETLDYPGAATVSGKSPTSHPTETGAQL